MGQSMTRKIMMLVAALVAVACGTNYYIDFASGSDANNGTSAETSWKYCKGMKRASANAAAVTLSGGDSVFFKGGVTWDSSAIQWVQSGGSSSYVVYTSKNTWYAGDAYTYPVIDGKNVVPEGGPTGGAVQGASYSKTEKIKFTNLDRADSNSRRYGIVFNNKHHYFVQSCSLSTHTWLTIHNNFGVAGTYDSLSFINNDFTGTSNAIWVASGGSGIAIKHLTIKGNTFHDYHNDMIGGTHGNGLHYYNSGAGSDETEYMDSVIYCDNKAYGDFTSVGTYVDSVSGGGMTALFFFEGCVANAKVYNNDFSFSPAQTGMFQSLFSLSGRGHPKGKKIEIYNNTCINYGTNSMSACLYATGMTTSDTVIFKNNLLYGMTNAIHMNAAGDSAALREMDYNVLHSLNSTPFRLVSTYYNITQWRSRGFDGHSTTDNPYFVSITTDNQLSDSSSAIDIGADLSGIFTVDRNGKTRPVGSAWDIGAYEYGTQSEGRTKTKWSGILQ